MEVKPVLPSAEEFEKMSLITFTNWVPETIWVLEEQLKKRNPLFYAKKEISQILKKNYKSEKEKEEAVLLKLRSYYREHFRQD